jgi:membrane-bound lytic murein transglycosylase D
MKLQLKSALYIILGAAIATSAIIGMSFRKSNKDETTVEVKEDGRLQYKWYVPELPKTMNFAGEKVPLERQDIREQFERELLYNYYNQYSTLYILKLSTRYFPLIEQRLKANGVPDDFKYLCVAESALRNQTSSAGAVGFWQFMKTTGPTYGLEINDEVDERYHVAKSTDAACMYLKDAYAKFGSWTAAAASYNCGMGGYNKFSSFQQTSDYYNLLLPEETMRYVFRIITFKHLISSAERMGYMVPFAEGYKPIPTRAITIDATIPDLSQFALNNGSNYRTLKTLNPWLREHTLKVKPGKTYVIELPAK